MAHWQSWGCLSSVKTAREFCDYREFSSRCLRINLRVQPFRDLAVEPALRTDMSSDKTIQRVLDPREQEQATIRYWQSLPLGDRLSAVWDASEAAYSFAAAFKGGPPDHDGRPFERTLTRVQRPRR